MNNSMKSVILLVLAFVAVVSGTILSGEGYKALQFNGSNYIRVPKAASALAGKEFSFEAWIMVPVSSTNGNSDGVNRPIVSRFNSSVPHPNDKINDFSLQVNPDGIVVFFVGGSKDLGFVMAAANPLEANRWYHVAFTIEYDDITSDFPRSAVLYVDNYFSAATITRDRQSSVWYGPGYKRVVLTGESINIGMYQNDDEDYSLGHYFEGVMDEIRLWKGRRLASEITNYANRTLNDVRLDTWALTPDQGGLSSNQLVFSYNLNQDGSIAYDKSANQFHGNILAGPFSSQAPKFVPAGEKLYTFAYAVGSVPVLINLYGIDTNNISADLSFQINFNPSDLKGELYVYDPNNVGTPSGVANPTRPTGIITPGVGARITPGQFLHSSQIVYIYVPSLGSGTGKFSYSAVSSNGTFSQPSSVRIPISCEDDQTRVDSCGVCDGGDAAVDVCGDCFGNGQRCLGCDGVVDSNLHYDACGVCNGTNTTCAGCDGVANSHTQYDACGVCGGHNNTCGGCDNKGSHYDICGVCNGTNHSCMGCDGVVNSNKTYDICGVCQGNGTTCHGCDGKGQGKTYDLCGVCGGNSTSCAGCDGVANSGYVYDFCGECGGNNGTCMGCDGSGHGEYDVCGVCRGDGSTCGGCDSQGGEYDICGVCAGDNSTCTCVKYHGYEVEELEYTLLQWNLQHTIRDIDAVIANLNESLSLLEDYNGDLDLASVVLYFNRFLKYNVLPYENSIDAFTRELDISLGEIWDGKPINPPGPIDYNKHYSGPPPKKN